MYWCTNNVLSLIQTFVLKNEKVKQALKIPNAPAPEDTPNFKQVNPLQALSEVINFFLTTYMECGLLCCLIRFLW